MPAAQTIQQWLSKNVIKLGDNDCWNATGKCHNKKGWHVAFKSNGKRMLAHRAAWIASHGDIQDGLFVLHKCDNPKCCNPAHLFLGTQSDNARDMWNKGRARQGSHAGVKMGPSKHRTMNPVEVLQMFAMFLAGSTQKQIAEKFGITDVAVSCALNGKTYPEFKEQREKITHLLGRGVKKKLKATREVYRRMTFADANQMRLAA